MISHQARYRLGPLLAAGPRAFVYLAESLNQPRSRCTLKVLRRESSHDPEARDLLLREASMLRSLRHPAIEPLVDVGRSGPDVFHAVHLSDGVSLRDLHALVSPSGWTLRPLLDLALGIFDALTFAHALGHSHGSLSADHVRIGHAGRVALWGFGLLELQCSGTLPEARPEARFARDVWSAGRLLRPIARACSGELPRDLTALIRAAIEPSAQHRPTASESLSALRSISGRESRGPLSTLLEQRRVPLANQETMILHRPVRATREEPPTSIMPVPDLPATSPATLGVGLLTSVVLFGLLLGFFLTDHLPFV